MSAQRRSSRAGRWASVALLAVLLLQGCAVQLYEPGSARRVEIKRLASTPERAAAASREVAGQVQIKVSAVQEITLKRRVVYNTIEREQPWRIYWEPVELLLSPILLSIGTVLAISGDYIPLGADVDGLDYFLMLTAPLNPFVTITGPPVSRVIPEPRFTSRPEALVYQVRLPVAGLELELRLLDARGAQIAQARATTDRFGLAWIDDPGGLAESVHVKAEGLDALILVKTPADHLLTLPNPP